MSNENKKSILYILVPFLLTIGVSLLIVKTSLANIFASNHQIDFHFPFVIYIILLFLSFAWPFLLDHKLNKKPLVEKPFPLSKLCIQSLLVNLPLSILLIVLILKVNLNESLFYAIHLIIFNLTLIIGLISAYFIMINRKTT